MKNMIMKLLGLNTLVSDLTSLRKENEELKKNYLDCCVRLGELETQSDETDNRVKHLDDEVNALEERVQEKIDEIEGIDTDDFVREDDINDRIESYINDNDIVSQSYVDDEIQSKVDEAIEDADIQSKIDEAIEDLDLESKPASTGEQDIETKVSEAIKVTLERMVKALADQQG